jgi:hypothetical protein
MTLIVLPPAIRTRVAKLFRTEPAPSIVEGFAHADTVADIIREQGYTVIQMEVLAELTKAAAQVLEPVPRTMPNREVLKNYLARQETHG